MVFLDSIFLAIFLKIKLEPLFISFDGTLTNSEGPLALFGTAGRVSGISLERTSSYFHRSSLKLFGKGIGNLKIELKVFLRFCSIKRN